MKLDKPLCLLLTDLIYGFTPPAGFDWTVQLLTAFGEPDPEAPRLGRDIDTHIEALYALSSYFLRQPTNAEALENGGREVFVVQPPAMLATYLEPA